MLVGKSRLVRTGCGQRVVDVGHLQNARQQRDILAAQAIRAVAMGVVRRKDFDLSRFWVSSSRAFETSVYHSNATLRVTARGLARLDVLGSLVAQAAAETATS